MANIQYTGIDTNESFCKPDIFNISFKEFKTTRKFDHIVLFAVHDYIQLSAKEIIDKLFTLLNNNGILYFKSHQLPDYKLDTILDLLKKNNSTKIIYNEIVYLKCELHKRRLVYVQYIKD